MWVEVDGYPNYEVSENGIIRNKNTKYIMKPKHHHNKYLTVCLNKSVGKYENVLIHRIVAKAFIPNPNNYNVVNHKDENKLNNNYKNLEYCDIYYNNAYGTRINRSAQTRTRVIVMDNGLEFENSEKAAEYIISIPEFSKHNLRTVRNHIRRVCAGSRKTAYKHKWYYKDSVN